MVELCVRVVAYNLFCYVYWGMLGGIEMFINMRYN